MSGGQGSRCCIFVLGPIHPPFHTLSKPSRSSRRKLAPRRCLWINLGPLGDGRYASDGPKKIILIVDWGGNSRVAFLTGSSIISLDCYRLTMNRETRDKRNHWNRGEREREREHCHPEYIRHLLAWRKPLHTDPGTCSRRTMTREACLVAAPWQCQSLHLASRGGERGPKGRASTAHPSLFLPFPGSLSSIVMLPHSAPSQSHESRVRCVMFLSGLLGPCLVPC